MEEKLLHPDKVLDDFRTKVVGDRLILASLLFSFSWFDHLPTPAPSLSRELKCSLKLDCKIPQAVKRVNSSVCKELSITDKGLNLKSSPAHQTTLFCASFLSLKGELGFLVLVCNENAFKIIPFFKMFSACLGGQELVCS